MRVFVPTTDKDKIRELFKDHREKLWCFSRLKGFTVSDNDAEVYDNYNGWGKVSTDFVING